MCARRRRAEEDPAALAATGEVLDPVEDELWAEADEVLHRPDRWAVTGASWDGPALRALTSAIP
jgi:hypothetical protein